MRKTKIMIRWFPIGIIIILIGSLGFTSALQPGNLVNAFKLGNSQELARYFNDNLELVLLDKEDVYSKVQAEHIVHEFFLKYKPKDFIVQSQGPKNEYTIGKLITADRVFRVYFLLKKSKEQVFIHQLRIESEDSER